MPSVAVWAFSFVMIAKLFIIPPCQWL